MPQPKGINKEDLERLQRAHPNRDPLPGQLGVKTYVGGTITEIEERRFPWLKARRRRARTQDPE